MTTARRYGESHDTFGLSSAGLSVRWASSGTHDVCSSDLRKDVIRNDQRELSFSACFCSRELCIIPAVSTASLAACSQTLLLRGSTSMLQRPRLGLLLGSPLCPRAQWRTSSFTQVRHDCSQDSFDISRDGVLFGCKPWNSSFQGSCPTSPLVPSCQFGVDRKLDG